MKEYYTIGEMAKLNFISPHTLRYYDKIGLLKPSYTNERNGYRYYSYKDFLFLDSIEYLRHFGMSLEEIKAQFENRTVESTRQLYEKQLVKLRENIAALKNIEKRIAHNIENLRTSSSGQFQETPQLVRLGKRRAVILNDTVKNDDEYEVAIRELGHVLYNNNFQYMGEYIGIKDEEDIRCGNYNTTKNIGNMCIGKPPHTSHLPHMEVRPIPAGDYLRMCYIGQTEGIGRAYQKLMACLEEQGLAITGEIIETYAIDCIDTANPEEYVTIIEMPVAKIPPAPACG